MSVLSKEEEFLLKEYDAAQKGTVSHDEKHLNRVIGNLNNAFLIVFP